LSPSPQYPIPQDLRELLTRQGARVEEHRPIDHATQYTVASDADRVRLNVYNSGKVLVQGKASSSLREAVEAWKESRVGNGVRSSRGKGGGRVPVLSGTPRLGIDEAGKGDYFGPLVVAGVRVGGAVAARALREIGVRDSKDLLDTQALDIASRIPEAVGPENVYIVVLPPEEYEVRRTRAGNINRLLGELDAGIIDRVKGEVEVVVVDQFAAAAESYLRGSVPAGVRLEVRPRAEDDAAVAAASILARARYLEDLAALSRDVGFTLPKGSTHVVETGRRVYERNGLEGLRRVAKVHFATTKQITGEE
jgi:ribonuclease HIII